MALVERDHPGAASASTREYPDQDDRRQRAPRLSGAARGAEYGVRTGPVSVDLAAVRERKRAMVAGAPRASDHAATPQHLTLCCCSTRSWNVASCITRRYWWVALIV